MSLTEKFDDSETVKRLWELIMMLPTQSEIIDDIELRHLSMETAPNRSWQQLFNSTSLPRRTYALQIIDYLLRPAPDLCNDATVEKAMEFKANFIDSKGDAITMSTAINTLNKPILQVSLPFWIFSNLVL
jgi:hypothetical protein